MILTPTMETMSTVWTPSLFPAGCTAPISPSLSANPSWVLIGCLRFSLLSLKGSQVCLDLSQLLGKLTLVSLDLGHLQFDSSLFSFSLGLSTVCILDVSDVLSKSRSSMRMLPLVIPVLRESRNSFCTRSGS